VHEAAESLRAARDLAERDFLADALREARGNVSAAARRCRLSRESFYRLLRKHHLSARGEGSDEPPADARKSFRK
jgi:transcriptional regulator of acetoin/glycerol metabolism